MGTLGRTTRNGKKPAARRVEPRERPHPAIAKLAVALREYKEALEQQAATAEILRALSRSSGDPQPVFQAIVDKAHRLCGAIYSILYRFDGENMYVVAAKPFVPAARRIAKSLYPAPPHRDHIVGRAILDGKPLHTVDVQNDPRFPSHRTGKRAELAQVRRRRAVLAVPLLRDGAVIGAISVGRAEARAFTKKEIALLQTFADQAVIAIENVRLFNETKEALEQQTATAEILKVISSSPTDLGPVFKAILGNATQLCEAQLGILYSYDGDAYRLLEVLGATAGYEKFLRRGPIRPGPNTGLGRVARDRQPVHIHDIRADAAYAERDPLRMATATLEGTRTLLMVPMVRQNRLVGALTVYRREVRPFAEKQIALLQTFADQAAIAIENVRLFNETKEALEQQTAASEVLGVISRSPTDLQPVFDAILKSATELCEAHLGLLNLYDGERLRTVAQRGGNAEFAKWVFERGAFMPDGDVILRMIAERRPFQIADVRQGLGYLERRPNTTKFTDLGGARTFLAVPLLKDDKVVGNIGIYRPEVRPFTDKQIALVNTFANQAVIAVENVRLFNETKEALEKQTATAEILRVISSSPTDTQPVFEAIVRNATRLCEAVYANVFRYDGELIHWQASHGWPPELLTELKNNFPMRANPSRVAGRIVLSGQAVRLEDTRADPEYDQSLAKALRYCKILGVPLLRDGRVLGALTVGWSEPGPVEQRHEDLLKTFADQAVIAIENVRLFNETKEALEQQTAISEVLRVISGSPTDVKPVLDAVAVRAARICEASDARIFLVEGDKLRHAAGVGELPTTELGDTRPLARDSVPGRATLDRAPVHIEDVMAVSPEEFAYARAMSKRHGIRTILAVPLLREQQALGVIMLRRTHVRPFTDKQIALLRTFADQAAIAIENVRLFNETKEALDQQTSTAEVLKTISRSTFDLGSVLQTLLDNATRLSGARQAVMLRPDEAGNYLPEVTFNYSADSPVIARLREHPIRPGRDSTSGRVLLERKPIHIADVLADPEYMRRELVDAGGFRTVLSVPMLRDGEAIGLITLTKGAEVDPFTERQMEVVTTFADQAVIAIENVRLFKEIEEKSAQLEIANKHKSDFLANMSHELRTPLNAIIGFSEALMDRMFGEVNEKQADYLKDIHESGRHLLSLINDILDLSKIEAGRMDLELSSFHLPTALSNAMTLIRERAQRHGIELGLEVDQQLGEFQADERKFKQIILNLLSNAVKFTPDGGRIDVCARKNTDKIEIAVKDTGIGIAPEDQAAVFEEFKQVGRDQMRKAEGTGLGLALTRRFVELHGGAICLESTPGKGSTFTVSLPLRQ